MFNLLSLKSVAKLPVFILLAFMFQGCTSQDSNSGEWIVDYVPAQGETYAAIHVFSSKTGAYSQLYAHEGKWNKNPNFPAVTSSVTKGNMKMQYLEPSEGILPGLVIYSATTGEWEQFYLEEKTWKKNPNFPQPTVTIAKQGLNMEFIPGSANGLAGLAISNSKKQFEMLYLDGTAWKANTAFPLGKDL